MKDKTVVIVGGGFSGTLVATHLLRQNRFAVRVLIVERRLPPTHGIAYSTHSPGHLLNVRASNMSAFPDEPDHFVRWARAYMPGLMGDEFVSRSLYGEYLYSILVEASQRAGANRLEIIPGEAVGVTFERYDPRPCVLLDTRVWVRASAVVLALGNFPPRVPDAFDVVARESDRYIGSPWEYDRLRDIGRDDSVLLVGTGLTMVDCLISLQESGHRGAIHAVSRRGLLPLAHASAGRVEREHAERVASNSVRVLVSRVRALAERAERAGHGWRAAVDALRPITPDLWRGLPERERARFLRHVVRYWEVHRHRVPLDVERFVASLVDSGRLRVRRARIAGVRPTPGALDVDLVGRTDGRETVSARWVVNCTGPGCDFRTIEDPFVSSLREQGVVVPDAHGLGVSVTSTGAVVSSKGQPSEVFYAVGPLRRGALWESTAVPELRQQATDLAVEIESKLARSETAEIRS